MEVFQARTEPWLVELYVDVRGRRPVMTMDENQEKLQSAVIDVVQNNRWHNFRESLYRQAEFRM